MTIMPLRKCSGLCDSHFGFTKRYETNKAAGDKKRYNRERMRAWRHGIKGLHKPCYKTHLYCSICKVWILKTEGYSKCPCCFNKLKGLKAPTITIKETVIEGLQFSKTVLIIYLVLCYVMLGAFLLAKILSG